MNRITQRNCIWAARRKSGALLGSDGNVVARMNLDPSGVTKTVLQDKIQPVPFCHIATKVPKDEISSPRK